MKNTSKILALVLVLMMAFAVLSAFSFTSSAASTSVRVYCDNQANYSGTMYCYYWGGSNGPTWPGKAMSKDPATGYWYYDIPAGHNMVIFTNKNAGSWQTGNLKVPTTDAVVFNNKTNTWSQYIPPQAGHTCNWVEDKDQYVAPTCTKTGKKVYNCTAEGCSTKTKSTTLSALGHSYSGTTCTRCSAVAVFTVAGNGAHIGKEWDPGNAANDMTYADGVYTKVYTNVAAGSYGLKCVRDHSWDVGYGGIGTTADKDGNYKYTVATSGSTVTVTLKGTTVTVTVEVPHDCAFSDPTCTEPGKCSVCGKTQGEALGHQWEDATCVAPKTCSVCSATEGEALGHNFKRGACTRCEEKDPNYVAPAPSPLVMDFTTWEAYPEGTYEVGEIQEYNQYFTFIHNTKSRIDGSVKEFSDGFYGTQRFNFGGKTEVGKIPQKSALMVTAPTSGKITVWWVSGGDNRLPVLLDAEGQQIAIAEESLKDGLYITTFEIPAAGTYYLGNKDGNNYWFQVKLELDACAEHTWDEGAITTYPTCKTPGVFTNTCKVCAATTTTELPASADYHYYVLDICAFCYDIRPTIVLGENTVTVPAAGSAFGMIQITEAGTYSISDADNGLVCIFKHNIFAADSDFSITVDENGQTVLGASWDAFDTTAVLEPGYYYIGVYGAGEHKVTINKHIDPATCEHTYVYMNCTKCGTANPNFAHNIMSVGANKVVCNQYHLVDTAPDGHGNPYQFTSFTVTEAGHYKFVSDKAVGFTIFTTEVTAPGADFTPITGESWKTFVAGNEVDLQPGTYMIGLIFIDGEGEYNITLEKVVEEPVVEEEPEELNFFQKIIAWIMNLINSILGIFKK